jgi:hypothetical protein
MSGFFLTHIPAILIYPFVNKTISPPWFNNRNNTHEIVIRGSETSASFEDEFWDGPPLGKME